MEIKVYDIYAQEKTKYKLDNALFDQKYNEGVIHQAVVTQLNNQRQGTKSTLTRSEVRGGGIKPWRQKGTGRARQGSIRAPQWNKGGVVFAPKPRDFSQKINKQTKRIALFSTLSNLVKENRLIVIDDFAFSGKTREVANMLKVYNITKKTLFIIDSEGPNNVFRASKNIPNIKCINYKQVNIVDLVSCNKCFISKKALDEFQNTYKKNVKEKIK